MTCPFGGFIVKEALAWQLCLWIIPEPLSRGAPSARLSGLSASSGSRGGAGEGAPGGSLAAPRNVSESR